jgi:hypothetical protein
MQGVARLQAKRKLGVMPHASGSARKCEGMDPHIPKATPTWGVRVLVDSQNFKKRLKRSKFLALRNSL